MKIGKDTAKKIAYGAYVLFFLAFIGMAIVVPLIAFENEGAAQTLYDLYSPLCHQKLSRSFCIFNHTGISIGDCTPQTGVLVPNDNSIIKAIVDGKTGYKIAVCSRDVGLYGAVVVAALAYPLFRKWNSTDVPPGIYFVLALVPLAIDGGLQILGAFHLFSVVYESTNIIRFLTGGLAGLAVSFYFIPLMMSMIDSV